MKHRDPRPVSGDDLGTLALVSGICMLPSAPGDSYDQVRLRNALKTLSGLLAAAATTLRGRWGSQPSRRPHLLFFLLLFTPTEALPVQRGVGRAWTLTPCSLLLFSFQEWARAPPKLSPRSLGALISSQWTPGNQDPTAKRRKLCPGKVCSAFLINGA